MENRVIRMLLVEGKSEETVATELGISVEQVRDIYRKFAERVGVSRLSEAFSSVEDELKWLYAEQKKRLRLIRSLEDAANIPFPDTKDNVLVLLKILEAISKLEMRVGFDVDKLREEILGDV